MKIIHEYKDIKVNRIEVCMRAKGVWYKALTEHIHIMNHLNYPHFQSLDKGDKVIVKNNNDKLPFEKWTVISKKAKHFWSEDIRTHVIKELEVTIGNSKLNKMITVPTSEVIKWDISPIFSN
jgi:hypothetical protein